MNNLQILVLYYSRNGSIANMAEKIAQGIEKAECEAVLRTVPSLTNSDQSPQDNQVPYVNAQDLKTCHGLALGSPARFGNMAAAMKQFWETTSTTWLCGDLIDKPATVFTSSSSMHGGNESTLLTMMLPLLHHGMLLHGLPYSEPSLNATKKGGTPYGASHISGMKNDNVLTDDEQALCIAQGYRLGQTAIKLANRH